jgi:thiol-disulfide isomerase/thioredoxin
MKILLAALTTALLLCGCVATSKSNKPLVVIQKAPEFSLKNVLGGELKSEELKGKVVVIDFWATWCVPCKAEIPEYIELRHKLKDQGVEFVGVTFDSGSSVEDVKPFLKDLKIDYPVVMGTDEIDTAFGGHPGYPTTFLVGKDWKVYRRIFGSDPNKIARLEKDITELIGKPVEPPVAKATETSRY